MMNKKIFSILTASTLVLSGSLSCSVYAYATDDLGALASSLGADTDYLNIPFIKETILDPDGRKEYSDESYFITTMEVLVHNGELNISNLQENTSKMSDISDSEALREKMKSECEKLDNLFIYNYIFKNAPAKDKIPTLLETAEKAYENNEYFHIGYRGLDYEYEPKNTTSEYETYLYGHYATGIGITDGSWTFNGKTFDKCVLTLDTVNTYNGGNAFSEDTCIYINSETYDYYIPKYSDSATEDIHIIAIDNDTMTDGDTSDLFNIRFTYMDHSICTITSIKDGVETVRNKENEYLDYCHGSYNGSFYVKADSFKIDCDSSYNYGGSSMRIENDDIIIETGFNASNSTLTFDGKAYHINGVYSADYVSPVGTEYKDWFFYENGEDVFDFYGRVVDGLYFEPADDSFFIESDTGVRFVSNSKEMGNIFTSEKTEIKYDENGITNFYIDKDKDGIFEHMVETGDVNCDGMIDASDASLVLQAYSNLSTGKKTFLNYNLSDWDSNGIIDSSDASAILQKYAELSTTK